MYYVLQEFLLQFILPPFFDRFQFTTNLDDLLFWLQARDPGMPFFGGAHCFFPFENASFLRKLLIKPLKLGVAIAPQFHLFWGPCSARR